MAAKKADLELQRDAYYAALAHAEEAESKGLYRAALDAALSAWDHVDGMMQFERRFESKEFASIAAIDLVLRYAPLLLDLRSLDQMAHLFAGNKRITKNTSDHLTERLTTARSLIWDNHRLWTFMEAHPGAGQDELFSVLGDDKNYWQFVLNAWEKMGLTCIKTDHGLPHWALTTRMGEVVVGKCPQCGTVGEAPKAMLLTETPCPQCRKSALFVFLPSKTWSMARE